MEQKPQILVLDDEPIVGKRLKDSLEKYECEVEIFEDGIKALERFNEKHFDIVVTDVRMEEIDGLQVLERIKAKSEEKTKVIIITGYATIEVAKEALIKGAFDFIAKPFKPNDLRLVIEEAAKSLGFKPFTAKK